MNDSPLLRIAGGAAVAGAIAQFLASAVEPDWGGAPAKAVRVVADNGFWNGDRLLDLVGVFLTVGALTIVGRTFAGRTGREWVRAGQPFLVLMAALGASAVATGATMKVLANRWADAAPQLKQPYLAAFDLASRVTEVLFFAAFMALALYLATLAAAILAERVYTRWIGWTAAASSVLVLVGDLLSISFDAAFLAVLAGYVLFMVVLVALGVSMWRHAGRRTPERSARTRVPAILLLLVLVATAGIVVAAASASAPAAPGKELIQLTCDGRGTVTVSVQRGENANGAGQIVDAKGHGIPVEATLTLTDLTTSITLRSETTATGDGNGHPNQLDTHCTGVLFQGAASDFFGTDLPPALAPTDTVQLTFDGFAVIKP
jgi:hypothetical protein